MGNSHNYPIDDQPPRGLCIAVNNQKFQKEKDDRIGSENDIWKLRHVFAELLGFCFISFINLASQSLRKLLEAAAKVNCDRNQCFVCIIMSHGNEEGILCSDGKSINQEEICEMFSAKNCPTLAGKPKIFIFQCCRGPKTNPAEASDYIEGKATPDISPSDQAPPYQYSHRVPQNSDMIIIHATNPGSKAYRDQHRGTLFIDALYKTFTQYKNERINFVTLITRMNNLVSRERIDDGGMTVTQVAMVESNLRLDLYLPTICWTETLLTLKQESDLKFLLELWKSMRMQTIAELQLIVIKLEKVCRDVRIARISGGCASALGGVVAGIGFCLIPVTFGISLGLLIPGTAVGMLGTTTALGATIADICKTHFGNKNATAAMEIDNQLSREINKTNAMIKSNASCNIKPVSPNTTNTGLAFVSSEQTVLTLGRVAARGVAYGSAYATASIASTLIGGATSLITVPIDVVMVGVSSYNLHNNKPSRIVKHLKASIHQLQQELDSHTSSTQVEQDDTDDEEAVQPDILHTNF